MNTDRHLACPTCGQTHPVPAGATDPHYCSIACYRAGTGLDDPVTGDGQQWCPGCRRYTETAGHGHFCSDACRVTDWRRRQPQRPPSLPSGRRVVTTGAMSLADAITEPAPARYTAHDSAAIIDTAVASLATERGLPSIGDAGAHLHTLASLAAQIDALLPATVVHARDQDYTWSEIAALLGVSRDRAQRLAARHDPITRPPIDD